MKETPTTIAMDDQLSAKLKAQALLSTIGEKDDPAEVFFELFPTPEEIHGATNAGAHEDVGKRIASVLDAVNLFVKKHGQDSADPDFAYIFKYTTEAFLREPKSWMKCLRNAIAYVALTKSRDKEASSQGTKKDQLLAYYLWRLRGAKDETCPVQISASAKATGTIDVASHDFLPSSMARYAPCSNCGNAKATSWCSGCCIEKSGKLVFATFYCNRDCMKAHWGTHKPACKGARALRRAAAIFTELWFEDLRGRSGDIEFVAEEKGLIEMKIIPPDRLASMGRSAYQRYPQGLFESEEQMRACVSATACEDVIQDSRFQFELFMLPACALVEAIHIQPKNAHKTVFLSYPNGKHEFTFIYLHRVFRITLSSGLRFAFDPAGAQNGWQEYLTPWDAYEQHRIHFIKDIRTIDASALRGCMGDREKHDHVMSVFQSIVDSCLNLRVADGGMKELLYRLPDSRFEAARESLIKAFKSLVSFGVGAD